MRCSVTMLDNQRMHQLHGRLTRMVMAEGDQWQTARISGLERQSRAEINTQRDLQEIMERLDSCNGLVDEAEKKEIEKRRKQKFLNIAVPHGIVTGMCIIFCIVFLVRQGNRIDHEEEVNDYLAREVELDSVLSTIHHEFESLVLTLCEDVQGGDLYQTYDITDKTIEAFLPDKNLVKWTILNLLRDYRGSDPTSDSFYLKLVKHARFYTKVVQHLRFTVQNVELEFVERDGWKLAYDHQLKTRQYFNVRMLKSTLRALDECFPTSTENHELFTTLELFVTELCSLLGGLMDGQMYLSLSYRVLSGLHQHILDQHNSTTPAFASLYENKKGTFRNIDNTTNLALLLRSQTGSPLDVRKDISSSGVTEPLVNNTTSVNDTERSVINSTQADELNTDGTLFSTPRDIGDEMNGMGTTEGNAIPRAIDSETNNEGTGSSQMEGTEGHTAVQESTGTTTDIITANITSATEMAPIKTMSMGELRDLSDRLEQQVKNGLRDNLNLQTDGNESSIKHAILTFVVLLLVLVLVLALTTLFVTILKTESELVIGVSDWLNHLTSDLNAKRDELYDIGKKIIPQSLLVEVDFHYTGSTMIPHYASEASFMMFSIGRFASYFSLFTPAQTIHILTLVMELVDERIEQYDVISVVSMGERQIVFSDKSYSKRAQHASEIANLALDIMSCCSDLEIGRQSPHSKLHITIGIHTGPSVGMLYIRNGVLRYFVTGHTMAVLRKVHKTAVPNRVQITEPTFKLLDSMETYSLYVRGNINVKDFSVYKVYWLNGRRISTGTSDCESMRSRIGSWFEMERKPLYRLDEIEGVYEPIDKPKSLLYNSS